MKMRTTNLIAVVMLLCCGGLSADLSSLFCGGCGCFDGFYVGAAGGVALNIANTEFETSTTFVVEADTSYEGELILDNTSDNNIYEVRPWGEFFAGWGRQCSCYYWGGRFGINFSNFNPKSESTTTLATDSTPVTDPDSVLLNGSLKTDMRSVEYTLDFKPGIVFCERTMLYGIIGGAYNKERLRGNSKLTLAGGIIDDSNEISVHKEKTSAAIRGGVGIEHMLNCCLSVQLNYIYTHYWSLRESGFNSFDDEAENIVVHSASFSTKTSKSVASIGLAYYF